MIRDDSKDFFICFFVVHQRAVAPRLRITALGIPYNFMSAEFPNFRENPVWGKFRIGKFYMFASWGG